MSNPLMWQKFRRHQRPEPSLVLLVRHFFGRFFDTESLSPQGDPQANFSQTLGILAVPSAFFVLICRPLGLFNWQLVGVRYIFLSISMILMGFIMVFEWEALFPDRRDYQILTPLPLRLSTLFLAKAVALGIFLGIFLIDINFFGVIFWPGIDGGRNVASVVGAHVVAMLSGGLFAALSIAALQGVLIVVLPGKAYRRVSVTLQTGLMAVLVMLLFLTPLVGTSLERLAKSHSPLIYYFPGYWFIGLYERMRPATHNQVLLTLGSLAIRGLACVAGLFVVTFLPFYRRHARKMLETPEPSPAGAGRLSAAVTRALDRALLKHPIEIAVFHFIGQTITRSVKHRLFLATYGGFGAALAVITLQSGESGLIRLPLTLSFALISGSRAAFNFPSELGANWAFQLTETSHAGAYLAATRKWIVLCAILPLFGLLAPMEFACFRWTAALFHLAFGISLSALLMEILFFDFRKVPFTCSTLPGKVNLVALSVIYVLGFTMYSSSMAQFESWLGGVPGAALLFLAGAALAFILLFRWHAGEAAGSILDYEDTGDPVVRTLGLTQ